VQYVNFVESLRLSFKHIGCTFKKFKVRADFDGLRELATVYPTNDIPGLVESVITSSGTSDFSPGAVISLTLL
jgi:hypothetical protein